MPMATQPLTIEHIVLSLLRPQPLYGYAIYQQLQANAELSQIWSVKQSMLYATLARMEAEGLLSSTREEQGNKTPRKVVQLTPVGEAALLRWLHSPIEHGGKARLELLAKVYCACAEHPLLAQELVASQRRASAQQLADLHGQLAALEHERSYAWMIVRYRIGQVESALAWLDCCTEWLNAQERGPLLLPTDSVGWPATGPAH